jgi:hypothetical protein
MRMAGGSRPAARVALFGTALLLLSTAPARSGERFTVCSITINSDNEIKTFQKLLPASQFDFVELADAANTTPANGEPAWLAQACQSGVRCDVLVLSGHFANTYAGSYGTTFAGSSGLSMSLEGLERRSCDQSCPGILANPLEVFLFGCRTLATSLDGQPLPEGDLTLLSSYQVPAGVAQRIVDEVRYRGEDTSNLARMRFVFSGVPRLYGFADRAPTGQLAAPGIATYLKNSGAYAKHLQQLRAARDRKRTAAPNRALERSLEGTTFTQSRGLDFAEPEYEREARACFLGSERNPVLARLEHIEQLLAQSGFVAYMRAMEAFFRSHDPASFGNPELAALQRIRSQPRARMAVNELARRLENPILRLEILRVARAIGWIPDDEGLRLQREITLGLLAPPIYGEARDLICGMDGEIVKRMAIRAEDVPPNVYDDEFGIQALGCLKPEDATIQERLARSLADGREWIARLAVIALKAMKPKSADIQVALAEQLKRPEEGLRQSAAEALRELKPSDPRVLEAIRKSDPSFRIDWQADGSAGVSARTEGALRQSVSADLPAPPGEPSVRRAAAQRL